MAKAGLLPVVAAAIVLASLSTVVTASETSATDWLERMGSAINNTSYRGVFVYTRGQTVHSMQIAHRFEDGMVQERLVLQDGGTGEIVRRGMNVVCVLPERGRVRLNEVIPSGPFAKASTSQVMPVGRWYHTELKGEGRVAGYEVVMISLTARDEHRYSHRLWLEKSTGLLVKSNVREADGDVLEQFQFTSLQITDDIPDSEFEIRMEGKQLSRTLDKNSGRKNTGKSSSPASGRTSGWTLGWRPDGFVPAATPRAGEGRAVAFSDGLAAFSVFVEPAGRVEMPTGVSRIGATTVYMRRLEQGNTGFLVTIVGEVPPETARRVAESVEVDPAFALGGDKP
nr:MucB/RseB C-terminal domain-containing protein [uncultured Marinobacter sp.]